MKCIKDRFSSSTETYFKEVFMKSDYVNLGDVFVEKAVKTTELSKKDVQGFVQAFAETINESLQKGEEVSLVNFGRFYPKMTAPRKVKTIFTEGKEIVSKPKKMFKFVVSSLFRKGIIG
jgi:nucleoid DNA-binding protein